MISRVEKCDVLGWNMSYIISTRTLRNGEIQEGVKGYNPSQCWQWREEGKGEIYSTQLGGGDTASKCIEWSHGKFRQSSQRHSDTTHSKTRDTSAYEVKKWYRSPSPERPTKEMADKGGYNRFNIWKFHHCILCTFVQYLFDHFTIMRWKCFLLYHFTISRFHHVKICVFSAQLHHISFTIDVHTNEIVVVAPF